MNIKAWLDRPVLERFPILTREVLAVIVILALAAFTRLYDLGLRPMSHDESLHTYYSFTYLRDGVYKHNPMMHGPLQFHLIALNYFLTGVNDFTARFPAALFSIASVLMVWYWRRYLGKWGALAATVMALISPYFMYYGRYARNEAFVGLFGLLMLYAVLRYLETGLPRYIYILTATIVLHLTAKETAFIYVAELLIFLFGYWFIRVFNQEWNSSSTRYGFALGIFAGVALIGAAGVWALYMLKMGAITTSWILGLALAGALAIGYALIMLFRGFGLEKLREERSFDLLVFTLTLILPTLSALFTKLAGGNPLDYSAAGLLYSARFLIPLLIVSFALGIWWNFNVWSNATLLFWLVFISLYTSLFTNGQGFFSGLIGSLGYWLEQQPVARGSQPDYYYFLIHIPLYEFLPAMASLLAIYIGFTRKTTPESDSPEIDPATKNFTNTFALLVFWSAMSLIAFTVAGEKMPWLTYHITLPFILLGGWGIGQLIEHIDWAGIKESRRGGYAILLVTLFIGSLLAVIYYLVGANPPFSGKELAQLQGTNAFILAFVLMSASAAGLYYYMRDVPHLFRLGLLVFLAITGAATVKTAIQANFIDPDSGKEYIVYAHGYTDIKRALQEIDEISYKVNGSREISVAYDNEVSWPMTWYMRNYPNARFLGSEPDANVSQYPLILVGEKNFSTVGSYVGENYYYIDYIRMVWPNMDYFNLTWDRVRNAITDKNIRQGLLEIWLNRDFSKYAEAIKPYALAENPYFSTANYTLDNWYPSSKMRLYIRKDIAGQNWQYGIPDVTQIGPDPYEAGKATFTADLVVGASGSDAGQFSAPRQVAFAPDGSFYVADSRNHRIQHFSAEGQFLNAFGTYGANENNAPPPAGQFNEPWGVAVGPDGSVYVADTWNHRIQKFSADGQFITAWGQLGDTSKPDNFYGPRQVAVDAEGRVYVADTGNNRILVFDSEGSPIAQFGAPGLEPGQFSEPTGVTVGEDGLIYVADTWNRRIQVFTASEDHTQFFPMMQWNVEGWFSQSTENKPFIAVDAQRRVFVSDPESYRILEFSGADGSFIRTWGTYGADNSSFSMASSVTLDASGRAWVTDSANNRLMRFVLP